MSKEIIKRNKETRFGDVQIRSAEESDEYIVEGYAIVWENETLIGSEERGYYETISRNALHGAHTSDVVGRYNHNDNVYLLCRTRNGSLELIEDDYGLKAIYHLQRNVQAHVDAYNMVASGLLDKQSFAFTIKDRTKTRGVDGKIHVRIDSIDRLFDVSLVDFPAYDSTGIYARSVSEVETELEALEKASANLCERDIELEILLAKYKN